MLFQLDMRSSGWPPDLLRGDEEATRQSPFIGVGRVDGTSDWRSLAPRPSTSDGTFGR